MRRILKIYVLAMLFVSGSHPLVAGPLKREEFLPALIAWMRMTDHDRYPRRFSGDALEERLASWIQRRGKDAVYLLLPDDIKNRRGVKAQSPSVLVLRDFTDKKIALTADELEFHKFKADSYKYYFEWVKARRVTPKRSETDPQENRLAVWREGLGTFEKFKLSYMPRERAELEKLVKNVADPRQAAWDEIWSKNFERLQTWMRAHKIFPRQGGSSDPEEAFLAIWVNRNGGQRKMHRVLDADVQAIAKPAPNSKRLAVSKCTSSLAKAGNTLK